MLRSDGRNKVGDGQCCGATNEKSAEPIPTPATFFTCTIPLGFF
jgi:hypothetical protein